MKLPIEKLGTPILTIGGVERPLGITFIFLEEKNSDHLAHLVLVGDNFDFLVVLQMMGGIL